MRRRSRSSGASYCVVIITVINNSNAGNRNISNSNITINGLSLYSPLFNFSDRISTRSYSENGISMHGLL